MGCTDRILMLRKKRGIAPKRIASRVGIPIQIYRKIEKGEERLVSFDLLTKLANYLDTSVDYLLGVSETPENPEPKRLIVDTFAYRLKEKRVGLGISARTISEKSGISLSKYLSYENDYTEPSLTTLKKISEVLGVSMDWLACREGDDILWLP